MNLITLEEIVIELKKYFAKKLKREYFLTVTIASIDESGKVRFCRAGHTPVLHYKKKENEFDVLNPKGIGIGLNDKGMFEKILAEETIEPEKDDILFFYTDGVTELMNMAKLQFGEERIKNIIKENADKSVEEIKEKILQTFRRFRADAPVNDDLTLILLKAK